MIKLWLKWLVPLSMSFIGIIMLINHDDRLIYTYPIYTSYGGIIFSLAMVLVLLSLIYTLISYFLQKNNQKIALYLLILSVPLNVLLQIFPASLEVLQEFSFPFLKILDDLAKNGANVDIYVPFFMILPLWLSVILPLVFIGMIGDFVRKLKNRIRKT